MSEAKKNYLRVKGVGTVSSLFGLAEIDLSYPFWLVNIWHTNLLRLYKSEIIALLKKRDISVKSCKQNTQELMYIKTAI